MLKRIATLAATAGLALALVGCAHPISMAPDLSKVEPAAGDTAVDKKAGYYIAASATAMQATTAGGGGDKVRYFPYRDLETGIYKALSTVFRDVTKIRDPQDAAEIRESGIQLLIIPDIRTTSRSDSLVTWPPTAFTVAIQCQVKDAQGKTLDTIQVEGQGVAEFDEFKSNFSLAAVRASNDALTKLMAALRKSPALAK